MKQIYKTPMRNFAGAALVLAALLMLLPQAEVRASNPYGLRANDVFRCEAGSVTLTATVDAPHDVSKIRWYEVPFYGTPIEFGPTLFIKDIDQNQTFFIDYIFVNEEGLEECGICDRIAVRVIVSYETIENRISYEANSFCQTPGSYHPTVTGISGGSFSFEVRDGDSGDELAIHAETGVITPTASDIASYEVQYTPPTIPGCPTTAATWRVTITPLPDDPQGISYEHPSYCASDGAGTATVNFVAHGYEKPETARFSSVPSGLSLSETTGTINLSHSQAGVYTITYTVPGGGGCPPVQASTSVTIEELPVATISYDEPFCGNLADGQYPSIEGPIGGIFSAPHGLSIDPVTGVITPTASTAGSYTVTYTITTPGICPDVEVETSVSIRKIPQVSLTASIYDACLNDVEPVVAFEGSDGKPPYTFVYKIGDGVEQSISTEPDASTVTLTHSTQQAGTYTYTLLAVMDDNGCLGEPEDESIVINVEIPALAEFFYEDSPYCSDGAENPTITLLEGAVTGTFSYVNNAGVKEGLTINASTGEITLSTSTAGTYTVTNTIADSGGCSEVTAQAVVVITQLPVATFEYPTPFCDNIDNVTPTFTNGGQAGLFSADSPLLVFEDIYTGEIDIVNSLPGVYTITNTINAANGCGVVTAIFVFELIETPTQPTISYSAGPGLPPHYCNSQETAPVGRTGAEGGTFAIDPPTGLPIDEDTGTLTTLGAAAGDYIVTLTIPPDGQCITETFTATADVRIFDQAEASIDAPAEVFFDDPLHLIGTISGTNVVTATWSSEGTGVFDDPAALITTYTFSEDDIDKGVVTITLTTNDPNGPCSAVSTTVTVDIIKAPIKVTSTGPNEPNTPYDTLEDAFSAIETNTTHTGDVIIYIYENLDEAPDGAELEMSGLSNVDSVTIIAKEGVTVTGGVIIDNSSSP